MKLPNAVELILNVLNENGYEGFIVGGCVRDSIMGKQPSDFDIATDALPQDVKRLFKRTYDTGIKHGTVTVLMQDDSFEVTTYRIDGEYKDKRHPETVHFTNKLEEDLSRRDFTVNAIAYNHNIGFVDCFGGREDISNKIIRGVGKASKRFQEDALRMLRAIRFSAQLNFEIELSTWQDLKDNVELIKYVSVERIQSEITKMLTTKHVDKLSLIWKSGLLEVILPCSVAYINEYENNLIAPIYFCEEDVIKRLALFFRYVEKTRVEEILKDLKFDNNTIKRVSILVQYVNQPIDIKYINSSDETLYIIRKLMSKLGVNVFEDILYLQRCIILSENKNTHTLDIICNAKDNIIRNNDCISLKQLKVTGNDLKQVGITNGKQIGDTLQHLFELVLKDPQKNNFDTLISNIMKD